MRIVVAVCSIEYSGRLTTSLPEATRVILIKADGSLIVHSENTKHKALNWMPAPCMLDESDGFWVVSNKKGERLEITIKETLSDNSFELGEDPGLEKDGVEAHLQELLAQQPEVFGEDWTLVRREQPTPIGPVDLLYVTPEGLHVAVEVKRRGGMNGVEQLSRYLEFLSQEPDLSPIIGVYAAQTMTPQARTLAEKRGFECVLLDYEGMKNKARGLGRAEEKEVALPFD